MTQIYAAVSGGLKDTIEVIKWDIVDRDTGAWNSRLSVEADINAIIAFWEGFFRQHRLP